MRALIKRGVIDVDEFFSYPCDTLARLASSHLKAREGACAFMQDRVHADLRSLPRVRHDRPIQQQFPRCAKLRGMLKTPVNGCACPKPVAHAPHPTALSVDE